MKGVIHLKYIKKVRITNCEFKLNDPGPVLDNVLKEIIIDEENYSENL